MTPYVTQVLNKLEFLYSSDSNSIILLTVTKRYKEIKKGMVVCPVQVHKAKPVVDLEFKFSCPDSKPTTLFTAIYFQVCHVNASGSIWLFYFTTISYNFLKSYFN